VNFLDINIISLYFPVEVTKHKKPLKMKTIIVLAALVAVALSAAVDSKNAQILRYENDNIGVDGYKFA